MLENIEKMTSFILGIKKWPISLLNLIPTNVWQGFSFRMDTPKSQTDHCIKSDYQKVGLGTVIIAHIRGQIHTGARITPEKKYIHEEDLEKINKHWVI